MRDLRSFPLSSPPSQDDAAPPIVEPVVPHLLLHLLQLRHHLAELGAHGLVLVPALAHQLCNLRVAVLRDGGPQVLTGWKIGGGGEGGRGGDGHGGRRIRGGQA